MKVNFCQPLKNLNGDEIKEQNSDDSLMINHIVGNIIANKQKSKDPRYEHALAVRIYNSEGEVDINNKDYIVITKSLKEAGLATMTEGQILELLEDGKDY